jgi:hypothetical protein
MMSKEKGSRMGAGDGPLRGWLGLVTGLAAFWLLVFVALPLAQRLPLVRPVMEIITEADVDAGSYWYTQSEETTQGALYVRNKLAGLERSR